MSFEATRTVWTMRDAGELPGGPTLTVTLALADRADRRTNEVRTGVRGLAKRCGLAVGTVRDALVEAIGAGAVEVVEPGAGTRPTRYRLALSTARAEVVDDNGLARGTEHTDQVPARALRAAGDTDRAAGDTLARGTRHKTSTSPLRANSRGEPRAVENAGAGAAQRDTGTVSGAGVLPGPDPASVRAHMPELRAAMQAHPSGGGVL